MPSRAAERISPLSGTVQSWAQGSGSVGNSDPSRSTRARGPTDHRPASATPGLTTWRKARG